MLSFLLAFEEGAEVIARRSFGTPTEVTEISVDPTDGFVNLFPQDLSGDAGDYVLEFSVPIDAVLTTEAVTVPVGVPFSVSMVISVYSNVGINNGRAIAIADFTGGLGYPTSGDVFNLPDGFTVNSVGASVEDNRFVGMDEEPPLPFTEGITLKVGDIKGRLAHVGSSPHL